MVTQLRDWFAKFGEPDPTQNPAPGDPDTQVSAQDVSASLARIDADMLNSVWWLNEEFGAARADLKNRLINTRDKSVGGCTVFADSGLDTFWAACLDESTEFSTEDQPDMIFLSLVTLGEPWTDDGDSISITAFKREASAKQVVLYGTDPEKAQYLTPPSTTQSRGAYDNLGFLMRYWLDDQGGGGVPGILASWAGTLVAYRKTSGLARGFVPEDDAELAQDIQDAIAEKRNRRLPAKITE